MTSAVSLAIAALLADANVTALASQRIHAVMAPQGTRPPFIVVTLVSEERMQILAGPAQWPR